jgi:hypothetical protein
MLNFHAALSRRLMAGAVIALALAVAACAPTTQAQRDRNAFDEAADRGTKAGQVCTDSLRASPRYADLLRRYPVLNASTAPLQALMSEAYATPEEGQTLLDLHAEVQRCSELQYAEWQATDPQSVAIFRSGDVESGDIYAGIIQRRITWGDGLKSLRRSNADVIARVRNNEELMVRRMDQRHQAEGEARRQAWGAMADNMARQQQMQNQQFQNQQLLNSINRPRSTNCNSFGNTVNCTSY